MNRPCYDTPQAELDVIFPLRPDGYYISAEIPDPLSLPLAKGENLLLPLARGGWEGSKTCAALYYLCPAPSPTSEKSSIDMPRVGHETQSQSDQRGGTEMRRPTPDDRIAPLFREPLLRIAAASGALNHSRCLQPRKFWHGQTHLSPIHIQIVFAQVGRRSTSRQRIGAVDQEAGARVPE